MGSFSCQNCDFLTVLNIMFIIALSLASVKELDLPHSGTPNAICFNNISVLLLQDMYKV